MPVYNFLTGYGWCKAQACAHNSTTTQYQKHRSFSVSALTYNDARCSRDKVCSLLSSLIMFPRSSNFTLIRALASLHVQFLNPTGFYPLCSGLCVTLSSCGHPSARQMTRTLSAGLIPGLQTGRAVQVPVRHASAEVALASG